MTTIARFLAHSKDRIVKIRLTLDNPHHEFHYAYRTDEGWESVSQEFTLVKRDTGFWVERRSFSDGVDCDGRLSHYSESECPLSELHSGYKNIWPAWRHVDESQRDYAAEAMGY